jgi:hypothetical protein
MPEPQPTRVVNLDRYGADEVPWSRAYEALAHGPKGPLAGYFLATAGADGRPHVAGVGAVWHAGALWFTSGPRTRKSRHLATRPECSFAVKLPGIDLTLDGVAHRVTDADALAEVVAIYRDLGWPAEAAGDAVTAPFSAPSAGPPPWHLYRFTLRRVVGLSTAEPNGATRWEFDNG